MQIVHDAPLIWHWRLPALPPKVPATMHSSMRLRALVCSGDCFSVRAFVQSFVFAATITLLTSGTASASALKAEAGQEGARVLAQTQAPHPVLDRILSSGRIVLAHRESAIPFSYYDNAGRPVGYALDLCHSLVEAIRKELNMKTIEVVYLPVTSTGRIDVIMDGDADLECGATANNPDRRRKVAFTVPHYITGTRFAIRADSHISQLEDFEDRVLVSVAGSTPYASVDKANRERWLHIKIIAVADDKIAMDMLYKKEADGFAMDDVQLHGLITSSADPGKFKLVGKYLTIEPLAIMMSKNDRALKKIVDDEMKRLIRSGAARALYEHWFMGPIPPRNVAMNVPMNYLLKDFWKYPSDVTPN